MAAKPVITVQVRELVAFALASGDLGGERDFVGSQRALEGIRGQHRLQRARPAEYQKEVRVFHDIERDDFTLRVQGRIDGLLHTPENVLVEEIKTVRGKWDGTPDPLHWAQARFYGFMYARDHALEKVTLQLTYLHLDSGEATELREQATFSELQAFFEQTTAVYLRWMQEFHDWCKQRDATIRTLEFPFQQYRPGQRALAVAAYRCIARGGRLFIEAPTGIGKTISVLFPAVKALAEGKLERIFYLTARTVGRTIAEKAADDMRAAGLKLRTVTLTAKEKICLQEDQTCDPSGCPFAHGYYDRHKAAMRDALARENVTRAVLEEVGRQHQVCPFELSLDVSSWVDAVICDYNYAFDPKVYLRRHFAEDGGRYAFLVDEAHNLVDRGRDMFSAEITTEEIREVRRAIKNELPRCAKALSKLASAIRKLSATTEPAEANDGSDTSDLRLFEGQAAPDTNSEPAPPLDRLRRGDALVFKEFPEQLETLLDDALEHAEAWLTQNQPSDFREDLLALYFKLHSFRRTAEVYRELTPQANSVERGVGRAKRPAEPPLTSDVHNATPPAVPQASPLGCYVTICESHRSSVRVKLFCLDPSFLLRQALERGASALFFSATLTPLDYYRELLGGSPEDPVLRLASPFPPENLRLLVQDRIRTDFKGRAGTVTDVASAIHAVVAGRPGNYLVYFPSYQYLAAVHDEFQKLNTGARTLVQQTGMSESARDEFLQAFAAEHRETLVGFAVMGGVFGEGIDLVGDRLIGAIVVGVGLPQLCIERDLIRDYFQGKDGMGFEYAYTFPGMNRVLQATGRVIRSEIDRGVVMLVDTRFGGQRYRSLFPAWWQPLGVRSIHDVGHCVRSFWDHGLSEGY